MHQLHKLLLLSMLSVGSAIVAPLANAGEGYDAGYEWAEENGIDDTYSCDTPSSSFNDGCVDYVEENDDGGYYGYDEDEYEDDY